MSLVQKRRRTGISTLYSILPVDATCPTTLVLNQNQGLIQHKLVNGRLMFQGVLYCAATSHPSFASLHIQESNSVSATQIENSDLPLCGDHRSPRTRSSGAKTHRPEHVNQQPESDWEHRLCMTAAARFRDRGSNTESITLSPLSSNIRGPDTASRGRRAAQTKRSGKIVIALVPLTIWHVRELPEVLFSG
ncbi:hypothetical protein IE81DRAFT_203698 [Ceraceosorus guamensis]|uniref:Uncharacterized protein n=1 Tax=Ceraceosorus guamensis TaxID=1522189 RepID=A0A316VWG7_9BASI|nr:hypothetical protein IE81DRAFT_203698 [Ceraceosorus guamensis]PWN40783.1 hypothetical protein IE81DRAFT_203698 [Ceraceosorus guamensis]